MEGPCVFLIAKRLKFLKGKTPLEVKGNTRENKEIILGKKIIDIKSHGKYLIFEFDFFYLIIHFLMYGSIRINKIEKEKKERLSIKFNDTFINFYNTSIRILNKEDFIFDPSTDIMKKQFDILKTKKKIINSKEFICDLLLDQRIFAGVGNIIKNEALFRAKVHPLSVGKKIEEEYIENLIKETISFSRLFYNIRKSKKSLKNYLLIYGKKYCKICKEKVKLKLTGKTKRKTYFCENCQVLF
ncbi:MAG: DNA-formamidopyrimidine glycosylase family protein [Candidatus Hydrothermales bacterium]